MISGSVEAGRGSGRSATRDGNDATDLALIARREAFLGFLARRLGNRADAEDVLQEFCLRVLARKGQLRDARRLESWLYSILHSVLNDHFRKIGRHVRLGRAFGHELQLAEPEPDAAETMAHVCNCVQGLVPQLRASDAELIQRIDMAEEDRASVAAELGLSRGALAVRLHRARTALRERLLAHCGSCCSDGFDDCSCTPSGCENPVSGSHCDHTTA